MAKIPKPDLSSPKKNVPAPEDPEKKKLKPGDVNFVGFDDNFENYFIGKKKWKYQIGGFNTAQKATELEKEFNDLIINIQRTGSEVAEILEKMKTDEKSVTDEQKKFVSESQIALSELGLKKQEKINEMINFSTSKCLRELNGEAFNKEHFDDDNIPLMRWFAAARDIINFLLVGDIREGMMPSTTQSGQT